MADFVAQRSIVRAVWGSSDLILLVFAGAAAEFALNRAVDWLFFTGRIPGPGYAALPACVSAADAMRTTARFPFIAPAAETHAGSAAYPGAHIPDWAYRDVLYLLIDYSERAYQLLHRPLTRAEQEELYEVFQRVGAGLHIPALPASYAEWRVDRQLHLERDLACSPYTTRLYASYRQHLGWWRYALVLRLQAALAPEHVRRLLRLKDAPLLPRALRVYGVCGVGGLRALAQWLLLPADYLAEVRRLDYAGAA